ncbi:MAG: glycosidase [Dehalococcoidia bacterium]
MQEPLKRAEKIGEADIVVGIPFYNEADTIMSVLETARKGLAQFYPDQKCVIVAAGSPAGGEALDLINAMHHDRKRNCVAFLLNDGLLDGKGWSIRAIMELADYLGADLALLEADLMSRTRDGEVEGLSPEWIKLLLEPIKRGEMDMVVSRFKRHYLEAPVSTLTYPLFTAIYNCPIRRLTGGQWGIAHSLLGKYWGDTCYARHTQIGSYGVDAWLATVAITSDARICEANLGIKIRKRSAAKAELVLRQVAQVLFDQIVGNKDWWGQQGDMAQFPLRRFLPRFGIQKTHQPDAVEIVSRYETDKFKEGFNKFYRLYERVFPRAAYQELEKMAAGEDESFSFPAGLWAQTAYHLILAYAFSREFARDDIVSAIIPLYHGFESSNAVKLQNLKDKLEMLDPEEMERLLWVEAEDQIERMVSEFLRQKPEFISLWEKEAEALKPPVPQITYREFIPGAPLIVPSELKGIGGNIISANGIYDSIFTRQKAEFERFVYERLQIPRGVNSEEIALAVKDFLRSVEERILPPSDLSTIKGTQAMVNAIFENFPHEEAFSLAPDMASWFLRQQPPSSLFTRLGYGDLAEMLKKYDPLDILALASWSEEREYTEGLRKLIRENIRPDHFAPCSITPLVVNHADFPSLVEMKDSAALNKISSRVVVSNLHKGMGGEFPKLRYFTTIAKNIVEAERFGKVWQRFAHERKAFGQKVVASIEGHWGREPLSAHAIFEDGNQRVLAERLKKIAEGIEREANGNEARLNLAESIRYVADSYHLALTLSDGTFVTCSAWSWASYSFKGGRALPPPLSSHVERDWTSREFLVEYYKAAGGSEAEVEETIIELMGQGREWEDLGPILLGTERGAESVVSEIVSKEVIGPAAKQPLAGTLTRFASNPVLEPIKEHRWESKYVLNPGTIRLDGKIYMVYRAFGDDEVSRLGLAVSEDGFRFTERLDTPIFEPKNGHEKKGCEDPRLMLIGDRVYMTYIAYDGIVAQIALASIKAKDFMDHRWGTWHRHGMVFPGTTDKDATLFPEMFNGKYAMLHRVDPHIWITFSTHLRCPWPRKEHKILTGSTSGMMWDGKKIGGGTQPIKTRYGWLLITHGVDYAYVYRLGVMLLDLANPSKLIYRSPNFVLEPSEECEVGGSDCHWVPNVVFTCGAVPREDNKEMLGPDDEIIVYYGAADTSIGIATAKVGTLIPPEVRG